MISKFIDVPIFIVSLVAGLLIMYYTMPDLRKIYVYPTPDNVDLLQYKDKAGNCFSYKEREVSCPTNPSKISKIPVQA
jgi:hypothetical protein